MSVVHLSVFVMILVILAALVGGLIWLILVIARRSSRQSRIVAPTSASGTHTDPSVRLHHLAMLLENGQITPEEYERQRAAIVGSV